MPSHVEQQIAACIAAVRARREQHADRAARSAQRAHGVAARHAAKLRRLAQQGRTAFEQRGNEIERASRGGAA
ncbi:hypothetical protein QWJ26_12645 [Streptomyces sp. CSDS2]|uniref:hypothetical protein n=1 Tax=Streptomyces sp. CSDS2 TaxID=3055051 RepID=UPI0025B24946|nr:hypothetical protein [Streptomyces sp. CSDS2]MDN3260649.1 hypothetical protein [Streptomyces sp. CSDS2]